MRLFQLSQPHQSPHNRVDNFVYLVGGEGFGFEHAIGFLLFDGGGLFLEEKVKLCLVVAVPLLPNFLKMHQFR